MHTDAQIQITADDIDRDLLENVGRLPGLEALPDAYSRAFRGEKDARRLLMELTVPLGNPKTWIGWIGPYDADSVMAALIEGIQRILPVPRPADRRPPADHHSEVALTDLFQAPPEGAPPSAAPAESQPPPLPDESPERASSTSWRHYANRVGFPLIRLGKGDREVLSMLDRILIRGEGWGPKDSLQGQRTSIVFEPKKLSRKGAKLTERTYQRSRLRLERLGLLLVVDFTPCGARIVSPAWWPIHGVDPLAVWQTAKERMEQEGAL